MKQQSPPLNRDLLAKTMRLACSEARHWLGATSPNPAVGAVGLDEDGEIISVKAHQRAGTMHAEATLIASLKAQNQLNRLHTLCVTLEPCNHFGRTPPCTNTIIESGVKNVVIGTRDPNPNVKGGGLEHLAQSGIQITCGIDEEECLQLIHAFSYSAISHKPWITIKRALNKNGSMIPEVGQKTFTSPSALTLAHQLRKKCDAILTGSGTILADNPLFTVRHVPDYPEKRRWLAIIDRRNRVPQNYIEAARERKLDAIIYRSPEEAIKDLIDKDVRDVLIEAGPALSQAVLDLGVWTMFVTLQQGDPDIIDVRFNPSEPVPFDVGEFRWDYFLPA